MLTTSTRRAAAAKWAPTRWGRSVRLPRGRSIARQSLRCTRRGATTHPGGSVSAGPGRNAAIVLLEDLGTSIE